MMNILNRTALLPVSCLLITSCASTPPKSTPAGYVSKTNGSFKLAPYKERVLENGLKIIFIKDTTLPRVSLTMMVKTGSMQEPAEKAGLNALTAQLLEQGTQTKSALELADAFGQLGSSLGINPGADVTSVFADSLSTSAGTLLDLFADVAMNPSFKETEISRLRSQTVAALLKKKDNPSSVADEKIDGFVFGNHPYGRDVRGTADALKTLTKQDIIKHYLTYYRPNNATMAVVGNFDEDYAKNVEDVFAKWTKRSVPAANVEAPPAVDKIQVKLVVKKGLEQAQIRIAALGISRTNDDYLRLRVANEVLGGSFASRLNQRIRSELGLTYSIYSGFDARKDRGSFELSTFTKNETAGQVVDEALKTLTEYMKTGAKDAEIAAARSQLIGQFPRAIETADRLAYNLLVLDFYGISYDYLTNFNRTVEKIGVKEASEAFQKVLDPTKVKIVVYGNEKIVSQFEKYQAVTESP